MSSDRTNNRLERYLRIIVGALLVTISFSTLAQTSNRFFGYFANNTFVPENYNHTNLTHVWAGFTDPNVATAEIMRELADAKARGVKAVVSVESYLFDVGSGSVSSCPFRLRANAASQWSTFVDELLVRQFLVPGDPTNSTVIAFYPVDEPELCGLKDQNGQAHPALAHAVNTIKAHPATANVTLAVIASKKYSDALRGIHLFDWVGMDDYSESTSSYLSKFTTFQNALLSTQRSILVPQAAEGGFMSSFGPWHNPEQILNRFLSDSKVIGIVPFLWGHPDTTGVRGIPFLKDSYTAIGKHIAKGEPLPLKVSLVCFGSGGLFECSASASRGVAPYNYQWSGASSSDGGFAIYNIQCGIQGMASVSVTDSAGAVVTRTQILDCPPGSEPFVVSPPDE